MRDLHSHLALALLISVWGGQPHMVAPQKPAIELGKSASGEARRFSFRITDAVRYGGTATETEAGARIWRGNLDGDSGTFTVIEREGRRIARIHLRDRTLEIVRSRSGRDLIVHTIDHATLPRFCAAGKPSPPESPVSAAAVTSCLSPEFPECDDADGAMSGDEPTSEAACGTDPPIPPELSWIDVMVAFTPDVESRYGWLGVADLARLSIAETNASFKMSGVNARVRLANRTSFWKRKPCVRRVDYAETGSFHLDLDRLLYQGDGFLEGVRAIRNECRADVVILLVNKTCDGTQGIACVMKHLSPAYGEYAMGIVFAPSATAHYTFTHELGHMMGGGHQGTERTGMCDHSKGYQLNISPSCCSTVMYDDSTKRTLLISNPHVKVGPGQIPAGRLDADNARTLRSAARTVAAFR